MKTKKTICILIIIILSFSLFGCDPPNYFHEDVSANVIEIGLINYVNPEAKLITTYNNPEKEILKIDINKLEKLETLPNEKNLNFSKALSKSLIIKHWTHLDSPNGICIRLIYSDNSFEIISHNQNGKYLIALYNQSGEPLKYIGGFDNRDDFVQLFNNYFTMKIE